MDKTLSAGYILPMSIEMLNVELVSKVIKENGWTRRHIIGKLGLGPDGYKFLRGEWLPKDDNRKAKMLGALAKILGVEVRQILLRLEAKRIA